MRPTRFAAMGVGVAAGLVATLGFVDGDDDAGHAEGGVVVALRCLGLDADGTATLEAGAVDELVRNRLVDLGLFVAAEADEVVDRDRFEADLAAVSLDLDRCKDDDLLAALAAEPDRWPCELAAGLAVGPTAAIDEVVRLLRLDCEPGAIDE